MESVKPEFLHQFIALAFIIIPVLVGVLGYMGGKRTQTRNIEPNPLTVRLEEKFADKHSNDERHAEFFRRISKAEADIAVHDERTRETNTKLSTIDAKVDRLLARRDP